MKIKVIIIAACLLMISTQDMNAQRGHGFHINVDQIAQDLELSATQIADLERLKTDIQTKRSEMRNSEDADWGKMREYKEAWKIEFDAILTIPQQEKLATLKEERMQEMHAQKELHMKARMEKKKEVSAYKEKYVLPVMQEKRIELDKKISKDDKIKVDILRNFVSEERETMKAMREQRHGKRDGHHAEKGHHGKRGGHHADKGHHGKRGHHGKAGHVKRWMEDNPETFAMAQELVTKYSDDIVKIQEEMTEDRALWKSEMDAIMSKGESKTCDPKNCDPSQCDPKDCDPKDCDPADCKPSDCAPGKSKRAHGKKGRHGKRGHHLSDEEKSFAKQLHFLLMDVPATEERSLTETSFPSLSAYPNPVSTAQVVTLTLEENQRVGITVIDVTGKEIMEVHKGKLDEGEHKFDVDVSGLGNNIYFYRVTTKNGSKLIQFVVARA